MFGEYAQIARYVQSSQESLNQNDLYGVEPLPPYLRPSLIPPQPWGLKREKTGLGEDFIMVAEFSELEGPKPLMTIPKDGGAGFDQNMFAVKILAVDHQHSTEGFTITEDAQVVYSDQELGVYAFVHHLVLFDNTARGFVRPYCIAYVTSQQRKIMSFYEEISWQMKKAARYLKYGNRMVFVGDLERHLKDLDHTKGVLLNQVSKMRLKDSDVGDAGQDIRKNAEAELYKGLQTIRQSNLEIMEILSILKPLLSDRRLEARFKVLEERAFQHQFPSNPDNLSLQENWYNDLSALNGLDTRYGSLNEPRLSPLTLFKPKEYKPLLVETKKAKRFNSALRGLHELCSWGAKEGLKKLRCFHEFFKRDLILLMLDRNESQMKYPSFSSVCHAECMTGNFLSGINGSETSNFIPEEAMLGFSREYLRPNGSIGSFDSLESFKSADSQSLSLAMREGSPSSVRTGDSQIGNNFESAQSSPRKYDFSLLTENEYYSDEDTPQTEKQDEGFDSRQGSSSSGSDVAGQPDVFGHPASHGLAFDTGWSESAQSSGSAKADHSFDSWGSAGHKPVKGVARVTLRRGLENSLESSKSLDPAMADTGLSKTEITSRKESSETKGQNAANASAQDNENLPLVVYESQTPQITGSGFPKREGLNRKKSALESDEAPEDCASDWSYERKDTLLADSQTKESTEATYVSSDSFQSVSGRPHAPSPSSQVKEGATEDRQVVDRNLGLTHHLASLHATIVRADSDNSSVFTEISSKELVPHLLRPEILYSSYKGSSSSPNYGLDDVDPCDDYVDIPASIVASPWRPKYGSLSVGDWVNNVGHGRPGYCLLEVLTTYQHMQHVIGSLLIGRPVLIAGSARFEGEVCRLVNALSVFVGSVRRKRQHVLEWMSKPPRVSDLTRLRLVGVCRPDRRLLESFIPSAVRQTCTIMDVEKKIVLAPPYQGHFIPALLSKRKVFKTDAQLLSFIQWWLMDIMSKAFLFYHSFCMSSAGSIIYSQSAKDQRDSYCGAVSAVMARLGVKDSDCDILEHLAELAKFSQLEQSGSHGNNQSCGSMPVPLRLHQKVCQVFRC
ncbi:Smith-Magenis syndrome chromosomal region candidate 8 [Plakobranchus ocellatus]|uniref:Smith-Magenis syndrome chromosomal region candidate 8 n=1 Tax=Plakobranchus ocellatus TaxID=259542 RepID=A0AAV3Y3S3_9GAST|nr:Smith-Magenis syndrome chromosomal region candidate 8 [Plakobranchus ocellatus]